MRKKILLFLTLVVFAAASLPAIAIYPLDKAQILSGARFDFKVEFDGIQTNAGVDVTINGRPYAEVLGRRNALVLEQDAKGNRASALIVRDVTLPAGTYAVTAKAGSQKVSVAWKVFPAQEKAVARNVIFLIADGLSIGHRTAARLLSKGNTEGTSNGLLNFDRLETMGLVGTSSVDAITVDSANSMSAYMTGHKSSINALGVYADRTADPFDDPKQETLAEIIRRTTNKSIGIISDAELQDATPAAVVGHTRRRAEKAALVADFYRLKPEVLLGGGSAYFIPQSTPGSKRKDNINYVEKFQQDGYALVTTNTELKNLRGASAPDKLLGLFVPANFDGVLDRQFLKKGNVSKYPDQPDVTTMTQVALDVLSKNREGFLLVVEAGLVDKYSHPMDWERSVYDTIMFDKIIGIALDYQKENPDTLVVVTGDHTHSISVYGTVNDNKPIVNNIRDKVGTYADAGFPTYKDSDGDGYPDTPLADVRLAVGFGNHPDYYETFSPHLDGVFTPAIADATGKKYVANEAYKASGIYMEGNLSYDQSQEVHSVDDQIVQMTGPGSEKVRSYQENTAVFRYMAEALGLRP